MEFGPWSPLDDAHLEEAADAPGAVQLGRADRRLVAYPTGRSAMVFYFYAARSMREATRRLFADELAEPGARGEGPLVWRACPGGDDVRAHLERLFDEFVARFGRAPILHPDDDDTESVDTNADVGNDGGES
jgi:hypothetical protein